MQRFSISFTLGKSSVAHQTNIAYCNREFIARNVDQARTHRNVTYMRQDVEDAYHKLFDAAVQEYNEKQKRADRKITDYYAHISDCSAAGIRSGAESTLRSNPKQRKISSA